MKVPLFTNQKIVDEKTGELTETWGLILNELLDQMQQNVSEMGFMLPQLPTTTLTNADYLSKVPNGTIVYDITANRTKVKENGVFKTITTV